MPTGYTASVQSGEITDFPEFAMQCARAFGALITMRDEPLRAAVPDKFEPSNYHAKALEVAKEVIARLRAMTPTQATDAAHQDYKERANARREKGARKAVERARYEAMISKVVAWAPPTPEHSELKNFMLQQLREGMAFDCGPGLIEDVEPVSGPVWLVRELERAERDMRYHETEYRLECERAAKRTAWVRALRESLSTP